MIKKKLGSSINPNIHHLKVPSSDYILMDPLLHNLITLIKIFKVLYLWYPRTEMFIKRSLSPSPCLFRGNINKFGHWERIFRIGEIGESILSRYIFEDMNMRFLEEFAPFSRAKSLALKWYNLLTSIVLIRPFFI